MLKIVIHADILDNQIIGVKELIAQTLEHLGNIRVVSVEKMAAENKQMHMAGFDRRESRRR